MTRFHNDEYIDFLYRLTPEMVGGEGMSESTKHLCKKSRCCNCEFIIGHAIYISAVFHFWSSSPSNDLLVLLPYFYMGYCCAY